MQARFDQEHHCGEDEESNGGKQRHEQQETNFAKERCVADIGLSVGQQEMQQTEGHQQEDDRRREHSRQDSDAMPKQARGSGCLPSRKNPLER